MDSIEILRKGLTAALILLAIRWVFGSGKSEKAIAKGDTLIFRGSKAVRGFLTLGALLLLGLSFYVANFTQEPLWLSLLFLLFLVPTYFGWPRPIVMNREGIKQLSFGGRWKKISWEDVTGIEDEGGYTGLCIYGMKGITMRHFPYHVDQETLLSELKKRAPRLKNA